MIRTAALSVVCATLAGAAASEQFFEVDRYDVTGIMSDLFDPDGYQSTNGDGWTFQSTDGLAELRVFGALDIYDGIGGAREITRQALLSDDSTITYKFADDGAYVYSGLTADGDIYYRYTRFGATCEGDAVLGSFVLTYDPSVAATYEPMVDYLIEDFLIGACG